MSTQDIIRKYLADHGAGTGDLHILDDESLLEAGIIDSVVMVELIAFTEKTFGIHVSEDDMVPENFETIDAIAEYVSREIAS